jgi:hypothetical protein
MDWNSGFTMCPVPQGSELYKRMKVGEMHDKWRLTICSYMTELECEATDDAAYLRVRPASLPIFFVNYASTLVYLIIIIVIITFYSP